MPSNIYHNHHITPRHHLKHRTEEFISRPENMILVTVEEHFYLHLWLYRLHGLSGDAAALNSLMKEIINPRVEGPFTGMEHSEESKAKMSESAKNRPPMKDSTRDKLRKNCIDWWDNATEEQKENRMVGSNFTDWDYERHSEHSKKIWEEGKMDNQPIAMSEWHQREDPEKKKIRLSKISKALTGRKLSEEHKQSCKNGQATRKRFTCPTCGKEGHSACMIRWHGRDGKKCPQKKLLEPKS